MLPAKISAKVTISIIHTVYQGSYQLSPDLFILGSLHGARLRNIINATRVSLEWIIPVSHVHGASGYGFRH